MNYEDIFKRREAIVNELCELAEEEFINVMNEAMNDMNKIHRAIVQKEDTVKVSTIHLDGSPWEVDEPTFSELTKVLKGIVAAQAAMEERKKLAKSCNDYI